MRRGQAAMEFLTTYGWAIMASLVAIGALAYFGVTDFTNVIPERCLMESGFTCTDFQLTDETAPGYGFQVYFTNNLGTPVTISGGSFLVEAADGSFAAADCLFDPGGDNTVATANYSIGSDGQLGIACTTSSAFLIAEEKEQVDFSFDYLRVGGRFQHSISGEITANVQ